MPIHLPGRGAAAINRELADLESRLLTCEQGGMCKLEPERLEKIETTLHLILRELAKINASLSRSARSRGSKSSKKARK